MNDGFANVVSAVQIGNGECCCLQIVDGEEKEEEKALVMVFIRPHIHLRKFVDLQRDINGDKHRKLYGPKISAETIYLRRSFQVIYFVITDRGNYSRE